MIEAIGEATIRSSKKAIIDFVTNLETYKKADWKIGRVLENRRADAEDTDNDKKDEPRTFFMRHDGKLRGVPGPAVSLEMTVTEEPNGKGASVRYRSISSFPSNMVLTFDGGFELTDTADGGVHVVHTERFRFYIPFRWVAEPFLRAWLDNDIREEMTRLKELLETTS